MSENPYLPDDLAQDAWPGRPPSAPAERRGCLRPNLVAAFFLLLTLLYAAFFATLIVNPYVPVNPFPPRTPLPVYVVATFDPNPPTATPTATKLPDTPVFNTLAPTLTPSETAFASLTPLPTTTTVLVAPPAVTQAPTATRAPTLVGGSVAGSGNGAPPAILLTPPEPGDPALFTPAAEPFTLYADRVTYLEHTGEQGCRWAAIAGMAVDLAGQPIPGLAVQVVGEGIDWISFTGTAPQYGTGGYEVYLNDAPLAGVYSVQLLDQSGDPISAALTVETRATCEANIAIVIFVQNRAY